MATVGEREALIGRYQNGHDDDHDGYSDEDDDETSASILASVREQEEQFAKLTREIEAERSNVTKQLQQSRNRASLDSISDTEDTYSWRQQPVQVTNVLWNGRALARIQLNDAHRRKQFMIIQFSTRMLF